MTKCHCWGWFVLGLVWANLGVKDRNDIGLTEFHLCLT